MENLEALLDVKEEFLKQNPHMLDFQKKIDDLLVGRTQEQKCRILQRIMLENIKTMNSKLNLVQSKLLNIKENL